MITVKHLTKRYGGFTALDDVSFELEEGRIYGLLGPNGAGKSTAMNIMTGCLAATDGGVEIDGHDIFDEARAAKKLVGYLPEIPPLYMEETPEEYLRFVAEAKGIPAGERAAEVERVMEEVHVDAMAGRLIRNLSKGYRQRVGIAQALLGNPKYIILDEPTVGLDPLQIIEIRDLIRQLGERHTVILSSHILSEVQAICESVLIIAHGRLVAFDTPDHLKERLAASGRIELRTDAAEGELPDLLSGIPGISGTSVRQEEGGTCRAMLALEEGEPDQVCRALFFAFARAGRAILQLSPMRADLEDIFIELTEGGPEGEPASRADGEGEENDEGDL